MTAKVPTFYLWINGEAREGTASLEIHNPYDNTPVAMVSMAGSRQIREAILGCHAAFSKLKHMSL